MGYWRYGVPHTRGDEPTSQNDIDSICVFTKRFYEVEMQAFRNCVELLCNNVAYPLLGRDAQKKLPQK